MTDMGYAIIETGILTFLIGVAVGLQYSKVDVYKRQILFYAKKNNRV